MESETLAKCSQVSQRVDSRKEEICTSPNRGKGWEAHHLSADRPFRYGEIECTILATDQRVSLVSELVKIWIINPDILGELKLPHKACAENECCNSTVDAIVRRAFGQRRTIRRAPTNHPSPLHVRRSIAGIHAPNMCSERNGIALRVHFCVIEVVIALVISSERGIVLVRRQNKRSSAAPASHQLRCNQFLALGCWATMLTQKVAKSTDMLLQSAIGHEGAISGESFWLRQRHHLAALILMSKNEFTRLDRCAGAGRRLYSASFYLGFREPIAITEMFVRVVKRGNAVKVQ